MLLLIPTEYLQYLWITHTIVGVGLNVEATPFISKVDKKQCDRIWLRFNWSRDLSDGPRGLRGEWPVTSFNMMQSNCVSYKFNSFTAWRGILQDLKNIAVKIIIFSFFYKNFKTILQLCVIAIASWERNNLVLLALKCIQGAHLSKGSRMYVMDLMWNWTGPLACLSMFGF